MQENLPNAALIQVLVTQEENVCCCYICFNGL